MKGDCPLTGEIAEVAWTADRVVVEHPRLGAYTMDANALASLAGNAGVRERIVNWIAESHALGIDIPDLAVEHVHLFERLRELEAVAAEWSERRQVMSEADEERLGKKLRLEWNYNSNHIEGNTLTYHETELLLIHGRTAGGHPMRHYEEMKAHDVAVNHVRRLATEERVLGEGDIRDLNKILLKEPFWHIAETADGLPTRKRIVPGVYKTQPNHVRTATGELHRFAEPEETSELMESWVRDFRRSLERSAYPLPLFLAESHWSFLRIHPFDDGNGRTARLLTNYVLLRTGIPPIVIKTADRDRYIGGLQNADVGHIVPLAQFMLENILWSIGLAVRAAKGESIRETGDIDKEIAVFVRRHRGNAPSVSDIEVLDGIVDRWIRPALHGVKEALDPIRELFQANSWQSFARVSGSGGVQGPDVLESNQWEQTKKNYIVGPGFRLTDEQRLELGAVSRWRHYTGLGGKGFSLELSLTWNLDGEGASFTAKIDDKTIASSAQRVGYAELEERDAEVDHTINIVSKALLKRIDGPSTEQN